MKKLLLAILMVLAFASQSFAATTYTAVAGGGNWTTAGTWNIGSSYPGGATGDTAIINATMTGTVTVNAAPANALAVLNLSGNGGTLAFGNYNLSMATGGVVTLGGNITTGTGLLSLAGNQTIDGGGITFPARISTSSSGTLTLANNNLVTSSTIAFTGTTEAFAGAFDITCVNFYFSTTSGSLTFLAGRTLNVSGNLRLSTSHTGDSGGNQVCLIKSNSGGNPAYINFTGLAANCKISEVTFTDVQASGNPLDNWYGQGTNTGITNRTSASLATAVQAAVITEGNTISGVAGTYHEAAEAEVKDSVTFGNTAATLTGNVVLPAVADVKDGVQYGPGHTSLEGELVTSGGGGGTWGF